MIIKTNNHLEKITAESAGGIVRFWRGLGITPHSAAITKTATRPENPRVNATITLMNNFNRLEIIPNAIKLGNEGIALQVQQLLQDAGDITTPAAVRRIYG